jgi:hypothetical protein
MWGADRINNIYPPMNLYPGNGWKTLTYSSAPTTPHKRSQQYARIRLVSNGRTEGCPPAVNRGLACRNRRQSLMGYCLLMLTCTQPSSLASLSARQSRATPSSGSSSCGAPIILRCQIIPCSAYSAEQSGHDCSQRGKPRICRV